MRAELAAARKRAAVRKAAGDWERAGMIDAATRAAIDSRYPDDRVSRTVVWRVLTFLFVWIIACAGSGIVFASLRPPENGIGILLLMLAAVFAAATEYLQGSCKFDGTGAEAAGSFLAATFALGGAAILLLRHETEARYGVVLLISALIWAVAWQRWGFSLYALFGAVSLFFGVSHVVGQPRLAWLVLAAGCAFLARRLGKPSGGNAGWTFVAAAGIAAAYASVNLWSLDHAVIEHFHVNAAAPLHFAGARFLAALATAFFPVALLAAGSLGRRRLLIDAGLASAALSLVTLRAYVDLGPLWLVLAGAGAASIVLALSAERWLDSGAARERRGLTADALFENAASVRALSAAATVLALSPDARTAPAANELQPGGGSYGGAGASGDF